MLFSFSERRFKKCGSVFIEFPLRGATAVPLGPLRFLFDVLVLSAPFVSDFRQCFGFPSFVRFTPGFRLRSFSARLYVTLGSLWRSLLSPCHQREGSPRAGFSVEEGSPGGSRRLFGLPRGVIKGPWATRRSPETISKALKLSRAPPGGSVRVTLGSLWGCLLSFFSTFF